MKTHNQTKLNFVRKGIKKRGRLLGFNFGLFKTDINITLICVQTFVTRGKSIMDISSEDFLPES